MLDSMVDCWCCLKCFFWPRSTASQHIRIEMQEVRLMTRLIYLLFIMEPKNFTSMRTVMASKHHEPTMQLQSKRLGGRVWCCELWRLRLASHTFSQYTMLQISKHCLSIKKYFDILKCHRSECGPPVQVPCEKKLQYTSWKIVLLCRVIVGIWPLLLVENNF